MNHVCLCIHLQDEYTPKSQMGFHRGSQEAQQTKHGEIAKWLDRGCLKLMDTCVNVEKRL